MYAIKGKLRASNAILNELIHAMAVVENKAESGNIQFEEKVGWRATMRTIGRKNRIGRKEVLDYGGF